MTPDIVLINTRPLAHVNKSEPLNVLALAAYLEKNGFQPVIHDEVRPITDLDAMLRKTKYAGITANTCTYPRAVELNRFIKANHPHVTTVVGGVHPTTMPEQALRDGFDVVVRDEGERVLCEILRNGTREGIHAGEHIGDEELYRPARHLIDMEFYKRMKLNEPQNSSLDFIEPASTPAASLLATRGCPFSCIFCHNMWRHSRMRFMPIERILEEMAFLKKEHGVGAIWFLDDHMFLKKSWGLRLFNAMIESKLNLYWASSARADSMDEELLEAAAAAGCRQLTIGIESGSDRVLETLNKRSTAAQNYEAVRLCRKHGIRTLSAIILGNPGETLEDIRKTETFLLKSKTDSASISYMTPYPGTRLWEMCQEKGLLPETIDFSAFDGQGAAPIQVSDFTRAQLEGFKRRMLLRFYLQPHTFPRLLRRIAANPASMFRKIVDSLR